MSKLPIVVILTMYLLLLADLIVVCAEIEPWKKYDMDRATYEELTSSKLAGHCAYLATHTSARYDPDFGPYLRYMDKRIKSRWVIKPSAKPIALSFSANDNGAITDVAIHKSLASDQDNREAIKFIQSCAPLGPFPPGCHGRIINFGAYILNVDSAEENKLNDLLKQADKATPMEREELLIKATELSTKIYGQDFPQTLDTMYKLSLAHQQLGKIAKEQKLLWQIVALGKNDNMRDRHEDWELGCRLDRISDISEKLGNYKEAERALIEAVEIFKKYADLLPRRLLKLGDGYLRSRNPKMAETTYKKAVALANSGDLLYNKLDAIDRLSEFYLNQQRYLEADASYKQELSLCESDNKSFSYSSSFQWFIPYIEMLRKQKRFTDADEIEKRVQVVKHKHGVKSTQPSDRFNCRVFSKC